MRVALVAGEHSGDRLGAGLIRALREQNPHARFEGIAGPAMVEEGCRCLYPMERLAVAGLAEAVPRFLALLPVRARLARAWIADPPDVFVGVDAPDFNLALEGRLRRAGVRTVHYVSPAVWAWRCYRVRKIARAVDLLLALFPFEPEFFASHGIRATFVGHPIADAIPDRPDREAARKRLHLPRVADVVALLPGSRQSELSQLAGPMVEAALWLAARREGIRFVVPLASPSLRRQFEAVLAELGRGLEVRMLDGDSWSAMTAADAVLLASGTATLEALLHRRPMVITYRTLAVTWAIGRRLLHVSHVGLPNLLAGRALVPELLQERATGQHLGAAVLRYLEHPEDLPALETEFASIHHTLRNDAERSAAGAVLRLLDSAPPSGPMAVREGRRRRVSSRTASHGTHWRARFRCPPTLPAGKA